MKAVLTSGLYFCLYVLMIMSQHVKYVDAAFMYQCLVYIHVPLCHATLSYGHQRAARAKQSVRYTLFHY